MTGSVSRQRAAGCQRLRLQCTQRTYRRLICWDTRRYQNGDLGEVSRCSLTMHVDCVGLSAMSTLCRLNASRRATMRPRKCIRQFR